MPVVGYRPGRFALDLGGSKAGWIQSVQGGQAFSDVVMLPRPDAAFMPRKHLAGVQYAEIVMTCGLGMSPLFYDALSATFDGKHPRFDGAINVTDYDGNIKSTLEFVRGLISEVSLPALDAQSKDAGALTVKIKPEFTRHKAGSGKIDPSGQAQQKRWLPANFRLAIDGLDCTHVSAIDALTVKQQVVAAAPGVTRDVQKETATLNVPNLVVTLAEQTAMSWSDWHKSFVIDGFNSPDKERHGTLDCLSADLKTVIFKLTFDGLGIFNLFQAKQEASEESVQRVTASMYCNQIRFSAPGASL